jgi:hypothetical protein
MTREQRRVTIGAPDMNDVLSDILSVLEDIAAQLAAIRDNTDRIPT